MIQHAARLMKSSGGGAIVNVSSINAVNPMPHQGIYAITKAGLVSMTRSYAKELVGDNIRVNALLPGLTATKFASALTEDAELVDSIPMKRAAEPWEMAGAVKLSGKAKARNFLKFFLFISLQKTSNWHLKRHPRSTLKIMLTKITGSFF